MRHPLRCAIAAATLGAAGCAQTIIDRTDRSVYRVIEDRQREGLGATSPVDIGHETGEVLRTEDMYSFTPHPTTPELPPPFGEPASTDEPAEPPAAPPDEPQLPGKTARDVVPAGVAEMTKNIFSVEEQASVQTFGLNDTLAYANGHAREVQDAKEELYLEALDLTLERHLWTPQFVASVQAEFADYGQVRDFDRAMTAVAEAAVTQRLPYGGNVSARVISSLMRDLGVHTTSAEPGNIILAANLPLLRGAGKVAYESRYSAERELIYAVRIYERFRRAFLVDVASNYFNLQQLKMGIANTYQSYESLRVEWEKADFIARMGQSKDVFEAPRALSRFRQAEASLVSAKEQYATSLDRFKIRIGMPLEELLDVLDQDADEAAKALDELLPDVQTARAVEVAVKHRLDLLNEADGVDDARRGVLIAKNRILPDLDASGSVTLDTDPERLNSMSYNTERTTWRGLVALRMDDRKTERNAYRESLVVLRKAERDYERAVDDVRADVRAALRRIAQQEDVRDIQAASVTENTVRLEAAKAQYALGKRDNRDVVDAENELLEARNDLARAIAAYRIAILEFRRDTETLRVDDDGQLVKP